METATSTELNKADSSDTKDTGSRNTDDAGLSKSKRVDSSQPVNDDGGVQATGATPLDSGVKATDALEKNLKERPEETDSPQQQSGDTESVKATDSKEPETRECSEETARKIPAHSVEDPVEQSNEDSSEFTPWESSEGAEGQSSEAASSKSPEQNNGESTEQATGNSKQKSGESSKQNTSDTSKRPDKEPSEVSSDQTASDALDKVCGSEVFAAPAEAGAANTSDPQSTETESSNANRSRKVDSATGDSSKTKVETEPNSVARGAQPAAVARSSYGSKAKCPVCHEDYKIPKILQCGDVLCRDCLVRWMRSNYPEPRSYCPVCRSQIAEDKALEFKTCEEFADALPTDLSMVVLVKSVQILRKEQVCCVCPRVAATCICLNCSDMLCGTCASGHKILSATRHHEIEELSAITPERLSASRPAMCPSHPDNASELFCATHSVAVCHVCATSKHRTCPGVTELEEKVREARTILGEMASMLTAGETALQEDIAILDQELQETNKITQVSVKNIEETCDRLERLVRESRRRLTRHVQDTTTSQQPQRALPLNTKKSILVEKQTKLSAHRQVIERGKATTPRAELWNFANTLQGCIQNMDLSVDFPDDLEAPPVKVVKVEEKAVAEIQRLLENLQVTDADSEISGAETSSTGSSEQANSGAGASVESVDPVPPVQISTKRLSFPRRTSKRSKPVLRFHTNHSKNVMLSNRRQTARRTGLGGIVLSAEPLKKDYVYEVKIDQTGGTAVTCCITVGVVVCDEPATITLPYTAAPGWTSAIVAGPQAVWKLGTEEESTVGTALQYLREGTRVGVLLDGIGCLHLYVGGRDQGVVARDVTMHCYAVFDMFNDSCRKITALPVQ